MKPRCLDLNTSTAITSGVSAHQLITFTTTGEVTLQPNTKYWLYVHCHRRISLGVQETASNNEDTESQANWLHWRR